MPSPSLSSWLLLATSGQLSCVNHAIVIGVDQVWVARVTHSVGVRIRLIRVRNAGQLS